jgi:hypothetical protein
MPSFADDRLVPGSERAVEIVGDKLMREIVHDFAHGPASLPLVDPSAQAPPRNENAGAPAPLRSPSGLKYCDAIAESFAHKDRMAQIAEHNAMVSSVLSSPELDPRIKELAAKIELLEKRLALQEGRDLVDFVDAVVAHDDAKTKKTESKK